ncbi:MAG: hypothetical protein ACLGI9_26020 [Thermoanaerobaculia bacterium]
MTSIFEDVRRLITFWIRQPRRLWLLYLFVYFCMGGVVQLILPYINIAYFSRPWQFATLYCGFLVPLSMPLRGQPWHRQYAYFVTAIMPIEIGAFILGTSVAYPHNILEPIVGMRNFTLAMVMIDSWIPYIGNRIVDLLWPLVSRSGADAKTLSLHRSVEADG